jgi:hypothetical protein
MSPIYALLIISQFININFIINFININFINIIIYHNAYMLGYTLVCKISQFININFIIYFISNIIYKYYNIAKMFKC